MVEGRRSEPDRCLSGMARRSNLTIATMPDGKPGVEWGIVGRLTQDGDAVPVKMFSDLIVEAGAPDRLMIIDHKTGSKEPGTAHQLALYASMIEATQGVRPLIGAYYMTRKATLTSPTSLNEWGIGYWDSITRQVQHAVRSSIFIPNTGWQCNMCSMQPHCQAVGGLDAKGHDSLALAPVDPVQPPEHLSWSAGQQPPVVRQTIRASAFASAARAAVGGWPLVWRSTASWKQSTSRDGEQQQ